jgi:hypothetical protein
MNIDILQEAVMEISTLMPDLLGFLVGSGEAYPHYLDILKGGGSYNITERMKG